MARTGGSAKTGGPGGGTGGGGRDRARGPAAGGLDQGAVGGRVGVDRHGVDRHGVDRHAVDRHAGARHGAGSGDEGGDGERNRGRAGRYGGGRLRVAGVRVAGVGVAGVGDGNVGVCGSRVGVAPAMVRRHGLGVGLARDRAGTGVARDRGGAGAADDRGGVGVVRDRAGVVRNRSGAAGNGGGVGGAGHGAGVLNPVGRVAAGVRRAAHDRREARTVQHRLWPDVGDPPGEQGDEVLLDVARLRAVGRGRHEPGGQRLHEVVVRPDRVPPRLGGVLATGLVRTAARRRGGSGSLARQQAGVVADVARTHNRLRPRPGPWYKVFFVSA